MARLMLSAGIFSAFAAATAVRNLGFFSGSPPLFAAMVISFIRRVKIFPRFASSAPFLCLIVAHLEWPDMERPLEYNAPVRKQTCGIVGQTPDYSIRPNCFLELDACLKLLRQKFGSS